MKLNENIERLIASLNLDEMTIDPGTGYLFISGIAAREGVQDYPEYAELHYRDASFISEMAKYLEDKPLTLGHYDQHPGENEDKFVGWVSSTLTEKGLLLVRVCIKDESLIHDIVNSKELDNDKHYGLSVGYRIFRQKKNGKWKDTLGIAGEKGKTYNYDTVQKLITVNHLAIVELGRGGDIVKLVYDEDNQEEATINDSIGFNYSSSSQQEDGSSNYPYPDKHVNSNVSGASDMDYDMKSIGDMVKDMQKTMQDMAGMYDMVKAMDTMMKDMGSMKDMVKDMSEVKDNLSVSLNYIKAIKEAYEKQDRSPNADPPTDNMIADEAAKFGAEVKDAVEIWVENHEALAEVVDSFSTSSYDLKVALLKKAEMPIADGASAEVVDAAYQVYRQMEAKVADATKPAEERKSETQALFDKVSSQKPASQDVNDSQDGIQRLAGGVTVLGA